MLPAEAELLASSRHCNVEVWALGSRVLCIQGAQTWPSAPACRPACLRSVRLNSSTPISYRIIGWPYWCLLACTRLHVAERILVSQSLSSFFLPEEQGAASSLQPPARRGVAW